MTNDTNAIVVAGRVGRDPELRVMPGGDAVLSFSVANNQYDKNAPDNVLVTWYNVSFFGKRAEGLAKFLEKGAQVIVTGSHRMRPYDGKNGPALSNDIRATEVQVIGGKRNEDDAPRKASGRNTPQSVDEEIDLPF